MVQRSKLPLCTLYALLLSHCFGSVASGRASLDVPRASRYSFLGTQGTALEPMPSATDEACEPLTLCGELTEVAHFGLEASARSVLRLHGGDASEAADVAQKPDSRPVQEAPPRKKAKAAPARQAPPTRTPRERARASASSPGKAEASSSEKAEASLGKAAARGTGVTKAVRSSSVRAQGPARRPPTPRSKQSAKARQAVSRSSIGSDHRVGRGRSTPAAAANEDGDEEDDDDHDDDDDDGDGDDADSDDHVRADADVDDDDDDDDEQPIFEEEEPVAEVAARSADGEEEPPIEEMLIVERSAMFGSVLLSPFGIAGMVVGGAVGSAGGYVAEYAEMLRREYRRRVRSDRKDSARVAATAEALSQLHDVCVRDGDKAQAHAYTLALRSFADDACNRKCADCGVALPALPDCWASVNLGVVVCLRCAGAHRALGSGVSRIKSLVYDEWDVPMAEKLLQGGNERARQRYLAHLGPNDREPSPLTDEARLKTYVRNKYVRLRWADAELRSKRRDSRQAAGKRLQPGQRMPSLSSD